MERACAVLGVKLIFAAPYSPETKGKIERFNRTVGSFIKEAELKRAESLGEFNKHFNVWLAECYHNRIHAGIDVAPEEAYKTSRSALKFADPAKLAEAFLHIERRKVDKSGLVSLLGKKYDVGANLIGRKVDVVYDAADTSVVTVEDRSMGVSIIAIPIETGLQASPKTRWSVRDFRLAFGPFQNGTPIKSGSL